MNGRIIIRVFYAGWDAKTLIYLLNDSRIQVIGVGRIETLTEYSCWPPDVLLAIGYRLYALNPRLRITALVPLLQRLCSERWRRHIEYFDGVLRNRIPIVGMESAQATTNWLKDNNADILLINAGELIPEQIYKAPKFGSINIHPSQLPRHRGALPTLWTLKNADATSAVTYHLLDRNADTGDILKQIQFDVSADDTWQNLEEKIDNIVRKTLVETIVEWVDGRTVPRKQDPAHATKTAKFDDYREIDLGKESAKEIAAKIQYYAHWSPSTPCYFRFGRLAASVFDAQIPDSLGDSAVSTPGKISRCGRRLLLQTKVGKLSVNPLAGMSAVAGGCLILKYLASDP
jgi:methionyl-tRNA formyltransferase